MLSEGHVLVADHTLEHGPTELYLPGPAWDRETREKWTSHGELDVNARAAAEVDRLLAGWEAQPPDPAIDREARSIIRAAMTTEAELPG